MFLASRARAGGPSRGPFAVLVAATAALLAVHPAAARLAPPPERFVVVSIDGLPAAFAGSPDTMAALTALAARGVVTRTGVDAPFPAWTEMLTGSGARRTLVHDEWRRGLGGGARTLAASLRALGIESLGLPADPLAHAASGLARGFTRWNSASPAMPDSARVDSALAWLGAPGPRFVWLALTLGAPAEAWRRNDGIGPRDPAAFAARARVADAALARLLAGLERNGLAARTLVVVAGTGAPSRGDTAVPVVFAYPGGPGRERAAVVPGRLADVAVTVLAAAGGPARGSDGVDRFAGTPAARSSEPAAVASDPLALPSPCAAAARVLMDRTTSPDSATRGSWDSLATACGGTRLALERDVALSRAGREALAARGLKHAAHSAPEDPRPALAYAEHLLRHGRPELVGPALAAIADENPFAATALWRRALAAAAQQQFGAAEAEARHARALAAPNEAALALPERLHALAILADSVTRTPRDGALRLRYGRALAEAGLDEIAFAQFHAARALLPGDASPDYELANLLRQRSRDAHAVATLRRALAAQPSHLPSRIALGDVLLALGRRHEAREVLEPAAGDPRLDARAWFNLACLRATDGDRAAALEALEHAVAAGYDDAPALAGDPDLVTLRDEPRFAALLTRVACRP